MIDPKLIYALCEDLQNRHAGEGEFDRGMRFAAKRIAKEACGAAAPAAAVEPSPFATMQQAYDQGFVHGQHDSELRAAAVPDMRAVCEALGFDPTNHHNAAQCPYCRPASDDAKAATHSCPWCGARVPEDDDCPQPPDVCHHEVVITDQAAKG